MLQILQVNSKEKLSFKFFEEADVLDFASWKDGNFIDGCFWIGGAVDGQLN